MLTELLGKGGRICQHAREGHIRCPLIVRPTSEDVITGHLFQVLRALNPRWWLPDLLNQALGAERFRQQVYRKFNIDLWRNRPAYPRELLPWDEGSTQVNATITWENPPTTVFVEVKYGSDLSPKTCADDGTHGFPSDQLIRNARVGLLECGWFQRGEMFDRTPRDFALIVLSPTSGHPLVATYRDEVTLRAAISHNSRLKGLPEWPFLGELGYRDIAHRLKRNRRWFSRPERVLLDDLAEYLTYKSVHLMREASPRQASLLDSEITECPPLGTSS